MLTEIIIRPSRPWWKVDLKELWSYRELLYIFAWRDVTVRYKQTLLGISWAVFQPLVTTGIFSIFFGKIAKIPSGSLPYPLFALIGLTIWNFFSNGVSNASNSLVSNGGIISKVYIPKLVIPLSSIITSAVDFGINCILVILALIYFGFFPGIEFLFYFPILFLTLICSMLGLGLFSAAINILYRDVRYLLPFFIQIGLYVSPIIYPLSVIYDWRKYILFINPLTSVLEGTRALISGKPVDMVLTIVGLSMSLVILLIGLFVFRRTEDKFVDIS